MKAQAGLNSEEGGVERQGSIVITRAPFSYSAFRPDGMSLQGRNRNQSPNHAKPTSLSLCPFRNPRHKPLCSPFRKPLKQCV